MIITVTLNAAIDRTQVVPHFTVGRRHRAVESTTLAGGHGINVARALRRLDRAVATTGLIGGVTGKLVRERLSEEGLLHDFHQIAGTSRTSTAVIDPVEGTVTEMNEYGPDVSEAELEAFATKLDFLARTADIVVFSGSLPPGLDSATYQQLLRRVRPSGAQTIVNSLGHDAALGETLQAEPSLTVVSQREAEEFVGYEFTVDEDFRAAFDAMVRIGGQSLVIATDDGVWARIKTGRTIDLVRARFESSDLVSGLGGVDVFVAGYVSAYLDDALPPERLRRGLAVTMANQRQLGVGIFDTSDLRALEQRVSIEPLAEVGEPAG